MRSPRSLGLALCLFVMPMGARAQAAAEALLKDAPGDDHVRGRVTMDPAFMLGVGYVRGVDLGPFGARKLGLHGDLDALIDFSSWDVTCGASLRLLDRPGFDVMGSMAFDLKFAQNEVHTALASGYQLALRPGYYGSMWYAATELGVRGNIATTVWQSTEYAALVPDAPSGTYLTGTTFLTFGLAAGLRFFEHFFFGLRGAYRIPTTFEDYGPWVQPMTLGIELGGTLDLF